MPRNIPKFGTTGNDMFNDWEGGPYPLFQYDPGTNDTIYALGGNDVISVSNGNDTVYAGYGNDEIYDRGNGDDSVHGEYGDDRIYAGTGFNTINGGYGIDTVDYGWSDTGAIVNLASNLGISSGWDTLVSIENVTGTVYNDFITGDDKANVLDGAGGNDTLKGGGGSDALYGSYGDDILEGGSGADVLDGSVGDDILEGGSGGDLLLGGFGFDYASYASSATWVSVGMNAYSSEGVGTGSQGDAKGDVFLSIEGLIGSAWDDSLNGDNGNNRVCGGAGNDIIGGGVHGDDLLDGGAGDDLIAGGEGNDIMTGGAGADKFSIHTEFDFAGSLDVITDFVHGVDKIDLSNFDARPDIAGNQAFYFDEEPDSDDWFDGLDGSGSAIHYNGTPVIDGDAGEVTFRHSGGNTYVYVSTGDYGVCAALKLNGEINLTASDFIFS